MKANLDKNLAPAWVSGKSYSTGEFCLYNKRLYICTTDNSDAEFDNSKWERRNLVDLVSGINSNLDYELDNENTFMLNNGVEKSVPNNTKYMFHYGGGLSNFTFTIGEVVTEATTIDTIGNYHNIGVVKSVDGKLKSYGDCFVSKIK